VPGKTVEFIPLVEGGMVTVNRLWLFEDWEEYLIYKPPINGDCTLNLFLAASKNLYSRNPSLYWLIFLWL